MRSPIVALLLWLGAAGCAVKDPGQFPPVDRFFFPVSVVLVEPTPGQPGVLYVVNSNFDLRYNRGTLVAVDLAKLNSLDGPVAQAIDPAAGFVYLDGFGGVAGGYAPVGATAVQRTLFVPTRADNRLFAVRADGARLGCWNPPASGEGPQDCLTQGLRLAESSLVKAQDPFSAVVDGRTLYVAHLRRADDYPTAGTSYLARLDAETLEGLSFLDIGKAPSEALAVTPVGLYVAGRALGNDSKALRAVVDGAVLDVGLTTGTGVREARGLGLSSDGTRLYVAVRGPDASETIALPKGSGPDGLLVLDISPDPVTGLGRNQVLGLTTLPKGPSEVAVIPRPGQRDLVVISCTQGDAVALYDDQLGQVAAVVGGIREPFGVAVGQRPGGGARVYVASFGNDTVDVLDLADLERPREVRLLGRLGAPAHASAEGEGNP